MGRITGVSRCSSCLWAVLVHHYQASLPSVAQDDDAQRQFNSKFLEELRSNSSKRMAWTPQDRVDMLKWLARGQHSKDTLCEDEQSLSKLAISIRIEPGKLHKKHRVILKRKMLSSMEYTLQTLKNGCQHGHRRENKCPGSIISLTWRLFASTRQTVPPAHGN
ncbi:hypothetical protein ACHAPT_013042 [Fusarium lateritium]